MTAEFDQQCINTLRFLSVDMVQKANSGHPGLPLGAAAMAYVLWARGLEFNPRNPHWADDHSLWLRERLPVVNHGLSQRRSSDWITGVRRVRL